MTTGYTFHQACENVFAVFTQAPKRGTNREGHEWTSHMFRQFGFSLIIFATLGTHAFSQSVTSFLDLEGLAALDSEAALLRIEQSLAEDSLARDPRFRFDLLRLKVDILDRQGAGEDAAALMAELAGFVATNRDVLGQDPALYWLEAAERFEALDMMEEAFDLREVLLAEYRDGARSAAVLGKALGDLERLARLLGDTGVADGYARQAAALRLTVAPQTDVTASNKDETGADYTGLRGKTGGFATVDVFYATDRARSGHPEPVRFYNGQRGTLELGVASVTIPHSHTPGVLEAPSIWRFEFRANPAKHVVLQSVEPVDSDDFFGRMQSEFQSRAQREALVFVHGYNVTFDAAARRAAQLAYDMSYPGVPILYSWPSRGRPQGYVADTAVVRLSARRLTGFLDDVVERSGAEVIHLVAHSMGNRALTDALELMALRRGATLGDPPVFGQVVFAAPDVDAGLFRAMLPTIRPLAQRLTLYASEEDWALTVSRKLHGDVPRAGLGGRFTLRDPRVDSIDMSELGDDMLAHSYFADDSSALADMQTLFWHNTNPARRCGLREQAGETPVWRYQRGVCSDRNLVEVLAHMRALGVNTMDGARVVLNEKVQDAEIAQKLEPVLADIVAE